MNVKGEKEVFWFDEYFLVSFMRKKNMLKNDFCIKLVEYIVWGNILVDNLW